MKLRHIDLDNSWLGITALLGTSILITGFLTFPPIAEFRKWSWDAIAGHFVGLVLAVMFAIGGSYGITEHLLKNAKGEHVQRSRVASYALCVLIVFAAAVLLGLMWSTPVEPGDEIEATHQVATEYISGKSLSERDALIKKLFLTFLVPSLLGVRAALGPKPQAKSRS